MEDPASERQRGVRTNPLRRSMRMIYYSLLAMSDWKECMPLRMRHLEKIILEREKLVHSVGMLFPFLTL